MNDESHNNIVPILICAFVAWRVVVRIRRSIGRQKVTKGGMSVRIGIYAVITLLLLLELVVLKADAPVFGGLLGGLVLGAFLGLVGLHLTQFEVTPEGRFYTPNRYVGAALSILFVARLAYRYGAFSGHAAAVEADPRAALSPLTMLVYGLLAGYYIVFFIGVLRKTQVKV
jgi:hypothetical protein